MPDQSQSFGDFVASRSGALLRTAFMLTGDRQLAEDLVQAALLKAARVWSRIETSPEAYVRKILYHENISWWRRGRVSEVSVAQVPELRVGTADHDSRLTVLAALDRLTPKQRTVLVLRYLEDLSESQTASVLGIGVGTVKSQTRQALTRIRKVAPDLSDLLEGAADLSGPADFDADALWRQANLTKRRHHVMTTLGVLGVVALVSGTVWWGGTAPQPGSVAPPAGRVTTPAMPSHIYAVPSDVEPTSSRLDIGPVAAVVVTSGGDPVAVSALDGSYRGLRLPGFPGGGGRWAGGNRVSVSPDGAKLAYAWNDPPAKASGLHVPGGIRVVNAATGDIATYEIPGGLGAQCGQLSWSVNGRYIVFDCGIIESIDQGISLASVQIGRLDLVAGAHAVVPIRYQDMVYADGGTAVADNGNVALASGDTVYVWSSRTGQVTQASPSFDLLATSASWLNRGYLVVTGDPPSVLQTWESRPSDVSGAPSIPLPGAGSLAGPVEPGRVALLTTIGDRAELATYSPRSGLVPRVEIGIGNPEDAYSFATGLLRSPTRQTASPSWPTTWDERLPSVSVIVVVTALGLVLVIMTWGRRRTLS